MRLLQSFFGSTLGRKCVMAVSGAALFLFVIGHMLGNLQLFLGPEALNRYAHFLQSNKELLWPVRLGLLAMLALHVWSALKLSLENKAARPIGYEHGRPPVGASLASRTMLAGGVMVTAFVVYHLLHYTVCVRAVNFTGIDFAHLVEPHTGRHDVYAMVLYGFGVWYVSLFYVLGVGALCLHLSHGAAAMFQSLGLRNQAWWPIIERAAKFAAVALFVGYTIVPAAVLLGYDRAYIDGIQASGASAPVLKQAR